MNKQYILIIFIIVIIVAGVFAWNFNKQNNNISAVPSSGNSQQSSIWDKVLDLSNKNLSKIPEDVFNNTELTQLYVNKNKITAIPSQIGNLQNLKVLDASNNLLTGVPAEIGHLPNLEALNLSNNKLTGLPMELGELSKLKILDVSGNNYSQQDLDFIKSKLPTTTQIITK